MNSQKKIILSLIITLFSTAYLFGQNNLAKFDFDQLAQKDPEFELKNKMLEEFYDTVFNYYMSDPDAQYYMKMAEEIDPNDELAAYKMEQINQQLSKVRKAIDEPVFKKKLQLFLTEDIMDHINEMAESSGFVAIYLIANGSPQGFIYQTEAYDEMLAKELESMLPSRPTEEQKAKKGGIIDYEELDRLLQSESWVAEQNETNAILVELDYYNNSELITDKLIAKIYGN